MEHDLEYPKTITLVTTFNLIKLLWMTVSRQTLNGGFGHHKISHSAAGSPLPPNFAGKRVES